MEVFVSELRINKVRHLHDLNIPLSSQERKHLIITGKNGSGKTSLLNELSSFFSKTIKEGLIRLDSLEGIYSKTEIRLEQLRNQEKEDRNNNEQIIQTEENLRKFKEQINSWGGIRVSFNDKNTFSRLLNEELFLFAFFPASRKLEMDKVSGPQKLD
jgi:uridine kinase